MDKPEEGIKKDINAYRKLKSINGSTELDAFMDLLIKTTAEKMLYAFTNDNIKSIEDFYKVRGEVISYLYPIQEVRGADTMIKHLEEQLKQFYSQENI